MGPKIAVKAKARARVLTDGELKAFWIASGTLGYPFGLCFQMLALLGQRLTETAEMTWSEIDLDAGVWTIPAERAKNHREHRVPLPAMAIAILQGLPRFRGCDFVFTTTAQGPIVGFNHVKRKIEQAIGVDDWVLHDLRRSVATGLQRLGVQLPVTEAVLNHVSGSRSGIVGIYQRHDYAAEKVAALNAWADFVSALVGDSVVALRA